MQCMMILEWYNFIGILHEQDADNIILCLYVLVATDLYSLVLASLAAFYLLGPACALNDMLLMMLRPCV